MKLLNTAIPQLDLPVEAVIEDVKKALSGNSSAVLQAPLGAGNLAFIKEMAENDFTQNR